jgi:SAM-dependent methyltransferase
MSGLHGILENPAIYRMAQWIFAPGAEMVLTRHLRRLLNELPPQADLLDVGCGPESWLFRFGLMPTGLDISERYVAEWQKRGARATVGSADALPFPDRSFGGIWSIGLLHHLPDDTVRRMMQECMRVCRHEGGYVTILDAVLPRKKWWRPMAYGIRRMDRGRFMRTEKELRALLSPEYNWHTHRLTYALTGLELLVCVCRFEPYSFMPDSAHLRP